MRFDTCKFQKFGSSTRRMQIGSIVTILAIHIMLVAYGAWAHSPTFDETAYLPAGLSHWHFSRFDLCAVNPPLVRSVAALPMLVFPPATDWSHYQSNYQAYPPRWFTVGRDFIAKNGEDA